MENKSLNQTIVEGAALGVLEAQARGAETKLDAETLASMCADVLLAFSPQLAAKHGSVLREALVEVFREEAREFLDSWGRN